jgi:hypothetical protein
MKQSYIELNQKLNNQLDPEIEMENEFISEMMGYFNYICYLVESKDNA